MRSTAGSKEKKITLTYEQYSRMQKMLVMHILRVEEKQKTEFSGVKMSDLIDWYLEEREGDIQTEEQLVQEQNTVKLVIKRMINQESILLPVKSAGWQPETSAESSSAAVDSTDSDPLLMVHPNYSVMDA